MIERALTTGEYADLVHSADIILLPYQADVYAARSSGILAEALAAGKPVVVPSGTWMSRQVERVAGNANSNRTPRGMVYSGGAQAIAGALRELLVRYDACRAQAVTLSGEWGAHHSPDRLVDLLTGQSAVAGRTGNLSAAA